MSVDADSQVVEYLHTLDAALARLPRGKAAELRQQIVEHLDEAVGPDADHDQIVEILDRLGRPEDLVAESLGTKPRRWWRLRAWSWHRWAIVAVVVAVLGSGSGYVVDMAVQPTLEGSCAACGWYYQADAVHAHQPASLLGNEWVTPDRPGQLQGFVFTVLNTSSWPETLLGPQSDHSSLGGPHPPTIAVGTVNAATHGLFRQIRYVVTPVVIPPGGYRYVRVTWRSTPCILGVGSTVGGDTIGVRVKIGWFTHDEKLQLGETFALRGVPQPNCPG
jgi:HAAS domain-containing protein